jgi:hypothetical protein
MIAGHLGIALGARRFTRTVPLWLLLIAAQLPDWLDAGVCAVAPHYFKGQLLTHSVPAVLVTAVGLAALYAFRDRQWDGALVLALLVISHVLADYLTGIKPTWPGGPQIGLGLYHDPVLDAGIEIGVVALGWLFYRQTLPERWRSLWVAAIPLSLLVVGQLAVMAIAITGHMPPKCY